MELSTPISQIRRGGGGQPSQQPIGGMQYSPEIPQTQANMGDLQRTQPQMQMPQFPQQQQQMPQFPQQQQMPPQQMPPLQMQQQMQPQMQSPQGNNMDENQLVDDILNDMVDNAKDDINVETANYAMSDSQIPSQKLNNNFLFDENNNQYVEYDENLPPLQAEQNYSSNFSTNYLINKSKLPLVVFLLFTILSLSQVNKLLFSFLPNLLNENGTISIYGIFLKAFIAMSIYICASIFL